MAGNRGEPSIWTFSLGWENRGPRDQRSHCLGGGDGAGLHSLQETVGCEIREDSRARGFRLLHFDGELLLSCYPEAHGCALPQSLARTLAMEMEKSWDTDGFLSKHYRAHVQGELCGRLRGYLESWTGFMERTVPPAVNVTRSQDSEGMVHLTCKAFGFFPPNISVTWFRDEEPMSRDTLESEGVLPDGNGTYYTWETIIIPQGEEQRVKCLVGHSGNHSTHLAPLGETGVSLEGVVTLGGSEARVRERRAGCGSGVPGLYIIRSFFRKHPSAPEIMVDHCEHCCCCSCCCYHRILCLYVY